MGLDLDTWITLSDLILKIVVAAFGGFWAVALLLLLRQREQAQLNLRKSEAEIRDLELKRIQVEAEIVNQRRPAAVLVDIKSTIHRRGGAYIIVAIVELTNSGRQNIRITWKDQAPAFYLRLVTLDDDGGIDYALLAERRVPSTLNPQAETPAHVVRVGGKESLSFAFQVSSPGLYLLSFRGVVDEKDRVEAAKLGVELPLAWTANRYVFVEDTQVPNADTTIAATPA